MPTRTAVERAEHQLNSAIKVVNDQITWIRQCGTNLAGYVGTYGSYTEAVHHGDGGEAIYLADINELENRVRDINAAIQRLGQNVGAVVVERHRQVRERVIREETNH